VKQFLSLKSGNIQAELANHPTTALTIPNAKKESVSGHPQMSLA
jgi:hypothetical protein